MIQVYIFSGADMLLDLGLQHLLLLEVKQLIGGAVVAVD